MRDRVELDAETLDVLMTHRFWARARARDVGVELRADAFVFSSRPDCTKPWRSNWVTKRFIAARCAAGLPHFPAARPPPLHGHRDARRRCAYRHGVPAPEPRPGLHNTQRLRPLGPGGRPHRGGDTRRDPGRWWRPALKKQLPRLGRRGSGGTALTASGKGFARGQTIKDGRQVRGGWRNL